MTTIEVRTQAELDAALDAAASEGTHRYIDIVSEPGVWLSLSRASGSATVRASGSATVRASGSATVRAFDSATVEASGSATVRAFDSATVEAFDSATVEAFDSATVEAFDSATVEASGSATVEAFDSATVRAFDSATVRAFDSATVEASGSATVRASGSATVRALDSATVEATPYVAVHLHSARATVQGGVLIDLTALDLHDVDTWADYTGAERDGDHVVLYKAVRDDYTSAHGFAYPVPASVTCPDWRDDNECGGGLHLSPHPHQARSYDSRATRVLRCRVHRDDLRPIHDPYSAAKAKARVVHVIEEVTR